ncbi:MAG: hypothetical protein Hens3KO_21150 [Henriciella sp.]
MTRRALSLPASIALVLAVQLPVSAEPEASSEKLTQKLDVFINSAVDDGILLPRGGPKDVTPVLPEQAASDSNETALDTPPQTVSLAPCEGIKAQSFEDFAAMKSYSDLVAFRDELSGYEGLSDEQRYLLMARANIAIGLNSEARMALSSSQGDAADVLLQISHLLEGKATKLSDAKFGFEACADNAQLWRGLNLIILGEARGVQVLRDQVPTFRRLPIRMRINVASVAVPTLERMGEGLLAQRIMAEFTAEEIATNAQLKFSQALLDYARGKEGALTTVKGFLEQPSAQATVMEVLADNGALPALVDGHMPIGRAAEFIAGAATARDETIRLRLVLDSLIEAERYSDIPELASFPFANMPDMASVLQDELYQKLATDLVAPSLEQNFSAINYLISDRDFLGAHPQIDALYITAAKIAADLGYGSLAAELGGASAADSQAATLQMAEAAYRRGDYGSVMQAAASFPALKQLSFMAGKAAIEARDAERFATFEAQLLESSDDLIKLLEVDAVSETWFASERAYDQIKRLGDPDMDARLARLVFLKDSRVPAVSSETLPLSDAFNAFNSSTNAKFTSQAGAS